jgi:group II intron reverse transcriptase/maturase/CRISPR-associated endonuclease Cas1
MVGDAIPWNMNDLFDRLTDRLNLQAAWQAVKTKGRAGGIDHVTIEKFDQQSETYINKLIEQLKEGSYTPEPYKTFYIPKNENEFRKLGLPSIKDKIVQVAAKNIIEPLFEHQFLNVSYGYRPGKGPVKAINRVRNRIVAEQREWVTLADIDNFFDTINPEILFKLLEEKIDSPKLIALIRLWVQIGSVNFNFQYETYSEGVPQGCILSPLLSNIYLHPFDKYMTDKNYGLVRYADDFVILSNTSDKAFAAYKDAKLFLETQLLLKLNNDWIVKKVNNTFEFLHILFKGHETSINDERYYRLIEKIDAAIVITDGKPDGVKLSQTLNGIKNFYGRLVPQTMLEQLDNALADSIPKKLAQAIQKKEISKQQDCIEYLQQIIFLSNTYNNNRNQHIKVILQKISEYKRVKETQSNKLVNKLIERKRSEYEELSDAGRELIISTPGMYIGKTQKGITVKDHGVKKYEKPLLNLQHITILSQGVSLSSNVIYYCAINHIPIDFIGFDGLPYAKLYAPEYPDASLGLLQTKAMENGLGVSLIKKILEGKLKNQLNLIKYYYKYRKDKDADYAEVYGQRILEIQKVLKQVKSFSETLVENIRPNVMGLEGHASACYWDMVVRLLNNYTVFEERLHKGATDLVNCLLNYGYGILYSRIWEALIREQLNPYISFLHTPQNGKPTLAFDLIEEFRQQAVDKVVFALITKGEELKVVKGSLNPETKTRLTEKVFERLNNKEDFRGKEMRLIEIIRHQAHAMALHLEAKENYKPYIAKW